MPSVRGNLQPLIQWEMVPYYFPFYSISALQEINDQMTVKSLFLALRTKLRFLFCPCLINFSQLSLGKFMQLASQLAFHVKFTMTYAKLANYMSARHCHLRKTFYHSTIFCLRKDHEAVMITHERWLFSYVVKLVVVVASSSPTQLTQYRQLTLISCFRESQPNSGVPPKH